MRPIDLSTFASLLEHDHVLACYCPGCRRWASTNLSQLVPPSASGIGQYRPPDRVAGSAEAWASGKCERWSRNPLARPECLDGSPNTDQHPLGCQSISPHGATCRTFNMARIYTSAYLRLCNRPHANGARVSYRRANGGAEWYRSWRRL